MYQRTFIVIFKPADKRVWWTIFINKRFAHCLLATYIDSFRSLVIDPSEGRSEVHMLHQSITDLAKHYVNKGWKVVDFTTKGDISFSPNLNFKSCVEVCKDFLGIKKWWVLTPKQLYREVSR